MAKIELTVELLDGILARIPEGFINSSQLGKRVILYGKNRNKEKDSYIKNDIVELIH